MLWIFLIVFPSSSLVLFGPITVLSTALLSPGDWWEFQWVTTVQPAVHGWVEPLRWDPCPGGGRGGGDGMLTWCPPGGGFWVRSCFWPWQRRLWRDHRWGLLKRWRPRLNLKVRNMSDGWSFHAGNLNTSLVTRKQMLLYSLQSPSPTAAPMCENMLFLLGEVLGK